MSFGRFEIRYIIPSFRLKDLHWLAISSRNDNWVSMIIPRLLDFSTCLMSLPFMATRFKGPMNLLFAMMMYSDFSSRIVNLFLLHHTDMSLAILFIHSTVSSLEAR